MNPLFQFQNRLQLRGGSVSTAGHPRWNENSFLYGIDFFGLNFHPVGWRDTDGEFYDAGSKLILLSSTDNGLYESKTFELYLGDDEYYFSYKFGRFAGSVRACRNASTMEKSYYDGTVIQDVYQDGGGNWYAGVKIKNLIWLNSPLRTLNLQDGTPITNVSDKTSWSNLAVDARVSCVYTPSLLGLADETAVVDAYGRMYSVGCTFYDGLVSGGGWRVATEDDYEALVAACSDSLVWATTTMLKGNRQVNHPAPLGSI